MKAIYPGSFDPITYGHIDIIERASQIFDELVIVIMKNDDKSGTFTMEERTDMVRKCVEKYPNVSVETGSGLTVDYARKIGARILIRGIRAVSDYEYEMQLATANMTLAEEVQTIFLLSRPEYSFLSSSTAKTLARYKGDLRAFVPDYVAEKLKEKFQ